VLGELSLNDYQEARLCLASGKWSLRESTKSTCNDPGAELNSHETLFSIAATKHASL
jgi:hypothetical protein